MSSRLQDFDKLSPAKQKLLLARLRKREEAEARSEGIPRSPRRDPSGAEGGTFPLSFAQQRLWFIDRLDPGAATYNLSDALLLEGRLDVLALERTLGEIVRRHEALRTVFDVVEGKAVQWIAPPPDGRFPLAPLAITDLSGLDPERADAEARRLAEAEAARPFDVPHGPHLRAGLLRLPGTGERERWLALLSMHHIVSDGWSMGVLVRELGALYGAFATGAEASLPELPIQYPDFADWQRRTLQGETLEEHLRWWRERLTGAPLFLDLPADRPRPAVTRHQGANFQAPLPADLATALAGLARGRGATPFMVLLAAFALLLARHSDQEDVVVGSPVANRNRLETEGLIGFFVNTLVLRVDAAERPGRTFLDLLDEVRDTTLGAYTHQDLPFERIVEELRPERDLSRPPLFQVTLVWQNAPTGDLQLPDLTLGGFHLPARTSVVDLSVEAAERGGEIFADWRFDTDLFDEPTVRRLAERFEMLLRAVVAGPSRSLLDLPMLPAAERQVLAEWSRTEMPSPREESLPVLLSRQVEAKPEAPAIEGIEGIGGERITYGGLWHRVLRLAHRLRALGVGPEVCVGICLERSADQVIAALAVIQAGGAYVPLDLAHPLERIALMLEATSAPVVITLEPLLPGLPDIPGLLALCLDRDRADVEREQAEPFDSGATADTLAYVMYTSGSTGTPKGVAIPHRGIARLARWCRETGIGPADSFLQLAPFAFDASTLEIWGAFLNGARLVIPPAGPASLEEIGGWSENHGVTVLWLTAGLFHQMADSKQGGALDRLASLRFLMAGGDALSVPHVRQVLERLPAVAMVNGYGPTENTTFTTCHVMRGPQPFATSVPLGRPIEGTRVVVLDRGWRPVPVGVAGELCTGGAGLARGYAGRPDLTANVFVPDAWTTDEPGERLYRTGDLARFLADGRLEFLGRIDQQVKIRGFRVEPGEIEAALVSHPEVEECSVVIGRDASGKRLVACVAPRDPTAPPAVSALLDWLAERLPEPMIPAAFLVLDALPLTANGKVDRRALVRLLPEPGSAEEVGQGEEPRTSVERRLAALWTALLGAPRVGVRSDFFALGGHSLLATQLVSRVRETFGVEIPLRVVFEAPTLAGLAGRIEAATERAGAALLAPIERAPGEGPFPLSFAQERLWFLDKLDPGTPTLNMPFSARLTEPLEEDVLAHALSEVVRRHESLRTTFGSEGGRPWQRIAPFEAVPLPVIDLRGLAPAARKGEARRLELAEALHPFDLARGPLLRARLIRLQDAELHLLLTLHHVISDGWSLGLLMRELTALYRAFAAGLPSPLPELPVQYADFAAWQRRWLTGEHLAAQIAYWRGKLGDPAKPLPVLDLPADRPRPAVHSWRGAALTHLIARESTGRLGALARREGATLFMVLLAGLQALLARWSGQDDVVVGTPVAGRVRAETEGLIGCFLNNLVLRTDLAGDPGFPALLGRVRATALEAYAHQDVPFEKLLEELRVERDLARTPLFQVFLNMLNFPAEEGALGGGGEEAGPPEVPSKFDLTIYATETAVGLRLDLVYNADLFDRARMAELGAQLELLLAHAAEDPEARIGEIPLLTPAARAVLPDPAQPLPRAWPSAVPERVAEHARRRPDAPAAVDRTGTWTYGQLDAHAGRLATRLHKAGIGTGDVVAVFAHRGASLAAALLGVWRSGAAFAILDPAYPPVRLAAILDLARPGAFLRMEAAGAPPVEVAEQVREIPRLELPEREEGWEALGPAVDGLMEIGPDDLAYVAFTSGSTRTPKGILGTHAPLAHFFDWHARTFGLTEADRFSVLSGLGHDPLLRDLFAPLWIGATLHVPDPDEMGDPGRLAAWMAREQVTVAHLTPAMGQLLAQGPSTGLPDLRRAFFGGDVLTGADLARLAGQAPRAEVVSFYGATETPQAMGWWGAGLREAGPVPLGRGIEGVQLLVLNPAGNLSGVGELGEIAIRTPYLALGYLGDPAATAERFIADREGVRVYRTGDLGRYRPDGAVAFAGRADAQIKIRGFRVEIGEIEAALTRHPVVREAAVTLGEGPDHPLLAFVVLAPGAEAPDLRALLRGQLPAYMMPAAVLSLDRLPLTPNRKVDRLALARLAGELIPAAASEAPRNAVEETLASLWGELLGTDPARIGIHQDFFDLGGHSLLAAQLLARIWDRFEVELPLRSLFERPTLAGMAELLAVSAGPASAAPPLIRRDRPRRERGAADETPPLSFAQQRLWFLHQLEPESPAYNLPFAQRLTGPLDARALVRAFAEVTRRHEVLRTRYAAIDGAPVQVIDPPREERIILPLIDLAALPEQAREAEAAAWVRRESRAPFGLAAEHPLRARLLRLGPASHVLALTLHHIASDGWSNGILVSELAELYRAFAAGRPAPLPELAVQYADFAVWQRRAFEAGALDGQRAYWRERLGDPPPPLELPTDRPRPVVPTHAGGHHGIDLPAALADTLNDLGRSRGATLFMTLLAGWAALLARYSGQDDLTIGTPVAGRTRVEAEPLIGFFVNTLVIRADLSGDPPFAELLDRIREAALGAFGHQDLPFEELVEELRPERDLSHPPLFQVMFVLQNAPAEALEVAGLTFQALPAESGAATFDLTLSLSTAGGGFGGMLQFKSDLFEAATIDRLLGHFRVLLTAAAARPEERLGDLPLLTAAEREQLLGAWNDTAVDWPDDLCLHELFERQVDREPAAIALVVAETGEEISYGELDARAGRLAAWLRAHGVGPEVSVGVALERSPELAIALLAVLKAGGAWVPLDPDYPQERLSFLIEDAAVAVLLTRQSLPASLGTAPARLANVVTPDHLAYRIYTSGSTGQPKAVLVPHRAIVNHMRWLQAEWPLGPSDVMLQTLSVSFDASFFDLWAPLLAGARLVLPVAESPRDAARLAEEIARFGVTRYGNVSSWLAEMVERPAFVSAPALRQVITGGQEFPGVLAERLASSGRQVVNFYGPSEAAVTATAWLFTPGSSDRIVPIGRPVFNVRVHVLGAAAEPLPAGVPGELCIGGSGVARGYGGRPELTADRFRPDPFSGAGARLYCTGDRVRWRADGVLEFLGRVDRQVKVRGFRIEPGEIEAVLAGHPLIREAAVVARGARSGVNAGDLRLVAYAVLRQPVPPEELRAWLAARLPEPMLPAAWVLLETLPRTPNGKVDFAALPESERVLPAQAEDRVAPRDALERELAEIWEELLDLRPVGVSDDFFALGGHSLLVLRLLARIEKRLGRTLSPAAIFAAPTIEDLANLLREGETSSGPLVRLHPRGDKPPLVLVHAAAGTVTAYAELARRLREADPDRPVWALQISSPLPESLEALAAGHVSALREAWPAGPYLLAGWSFGGVVAFEMARQLQAVGAGVGLLVLADTRAPGLQEIPRDLPSLLATFAADQGLPPDLDLEDREALRPLFETFREHLALLAAYRPAPYPGRIILFRAAENPVPAPPDLGWETLTAGELEVRPVPGDHAGVIRGEGAERLVAEILALLA